MATNEKNEILNPRQNNKTNRQKREEEQKQIRMLKIFGAAALGIVVLAVIIGIIKGDKILITKYRTGYAHSALVAGFTEFGETLEQTVEREVMEEVGLKVKNIRYYKSQPWALAQDILAGFFCEADGDETIRMDEGELKYAEWVSREEVELQPNDYSLTNEMMKLFKSGGGF